MKAFTLRLKHVLWKAWGFLTLLKYFQVYYSISESEFKKTILIHFVLNRWSTKKWTSGARGGVRLHPLHPPSLRACLTPLCITSVYNYSILLFSNHFYLLYSNLPYIPCSTLLYPNLSNSRLSLLPRSTLQFPTLLYISLFTLPEEHSRL